MIDDIYQELNSVLSPIYEAVPDIATILDTLITVLEMYHTPLDSVNTFFFNISLAAKSQDQFTLMWEEHHGSFKCFLWVTCINPQYVMG